MVKVIGLKGLAVSKGPTQHNVRSWEVHSTLWERVWRRSEYQIPVQKAMRNISNFEKIPERGRLLEGDGLVSYKVYFKI